MDDISKSFSHIYRSQGMLDFRAIIGNYDTVSILRGFAPSIQPSAVIRIIRMPLDGVL